MALQPLRNAYRTYGHLGRLRRIFAVLIKHGMGDVVHRLQLDYYLRVSLRLFRRRGPRPQKDANNTGARIRAALQELGPTFVKLGQMLSTRPDLVPAEVALELAKLQDDVPPVPFDFVRTTIEEEGLTLAFTEAVHELDPTPIAAGSIAQVHVARLKSGAKLAIKVQRPGVEATMFADLRLLEDLAGLLERDPEIRATFRPRAVVRAFERSVRRELDFAFEARTMEHVAENFRDDETVHIPAVYWPLTTRRVLAMALVDGIKVNDRAALDAAGLDRPLIARRGADAVLAQILEHGLFHGDPHPGNLCVLPGNVVCFLDFGISGRVDDATREVLVDLLAAVVRRDADALTDVALVAGDAPEDVDRPALRADVADMLELFWGVPIERVRVGDLFGRFFATLREHRIALAPDLVMLTRAIALAESVARDLDPSFEILTPAKPIVTRMMQKRVGAAAIAGHVAATLKDLAALIRRTPADLARILEMVKHNDLHLGFRHEGLEAFATEIDRSSNRLAVGLITAALIVGSALVVHAKIAPYVAGVPLLGVVGFALAAIMAFGLALAILRSGRL